MLLQTTPWKYGKDVAFYTKIRYRNDIQKKYGNRKEQQQQWTAHSQIQKH